jgi:hypothetical protein
MTLSETRATVGALADSDPTETVVVSLQPPQEPPRNSHHDGGGSGRISQTTEHLLIAAGSIGRLYENHIACRLLTGFRCYNHHRDDRTGYLYHAQAWSFVLRRAEAWQKPGLAPQRRI